eukprot:NODE_10717_length_1333_cov_16.214760.p1 GENE.NODE_10717_length_1333_cov_16.214760~~NODE_10717_length_1333_cov_16.214760.p1  ORF type:complete len:372 (+),score=55.78 NODE_10717_length_1333_cov_16.214760:109-1224(+)
MASVANAPRTSTQAVVGQGASYDGASYSSQLSTQGTPRSMGGDEARRSLLSSTHSGSSWATTSAPTFPAPCALVPGPRLHTEVPLRAARELAQRPVVYARSDDDDDGGDDEELYNARRYGLVRRLRRCCGRLAQGFRRRDADATDATDEDEGTLSDSSSVSSSRLRITRVRTICVILLAGCFIYVAVLLFLVVLPWGLPAYNKDLQEDLATLTQAGVIFKSVCWFKQHNSCMSSVFCKHGQAADIGGWFHHEGIILGMETAQGLSAGYIMFNYGYYGLFYDFQPSPQVYQILPFNSSCTYHCGDVPAETRLPQALADQFESEKSQPYNGARYNCYQFCEMIWLHFHPRVERCGPDYLPPHGELPSGLRLNW